MSTKARAAGAATLMTILAMLTPTGQASAVHAPQTDPDPFITECLAPIATPPRSPDVLQGWIDGCRRAAALENSASLGNHV